MQRDTTSGVERRAGRGRDMKRAEEGGERPGLIRSWPLEVGGPPLLPGDHTPSPWITLCRQADAERKRERQREGRGDTREPDLLMLEKRRAERAAWKPDCKILSESIHDVVPSGIEETKGKIGEIGMLFVEQTKHESIIDLDLGGGGSGGWGEHGGRVCRKISSAGTRMRAFPSESP
jgi:hypothetical protein